MCSSVIMTRLSWIRTWGELIEENRARLQFFQEHLQHAADESAAVRYLQQRHSEYLEGVVELDEDAAAQGGRDRVGDLARLQPVSLASAPAQRRAP